MPHGPPQGLCAQVRTLNLRIQCRIVSGATIALPARRASHCPAPPHSPRSTRNINTHELYPGRRPWRCDGALSRPVLRRRGVPRWPPLLLDLARSPEATLLHPRDAGGDHGPHVHDRKATMPCYLFVLIMLNVVLSILDFPVPASLYHIWFTSDPQVVPIPSHQSSSFSSSTSLPSSSLSFIIEHPT